MLMMKWPFRLLRMNRTPLKVDIIGFRLADEKK